MLHSKVRLGIGIVSVSSKISFNEDFVLEEIEKMGLKREHVLLVDPSEEDMLLICAEMKKYGYSITYQDLLENKIYRSKSSTRSFFNKE